MNPDNLQRTDRRTTEIQFPLQIKAVVIDLDGTLLDTAMDLASAANKMLTELGKPELPVATIQSFIGKGIQRLVKRSLTNSLDEEPDPELFNKALPIYQRNYHENLYTHTRPFPEVVEGLDTLKKDGFRLACITNKAEAFTLPLLRATNLLHYFEMVLSGDTLPKKKPDPLPLLHACNHFQIKPYELLLIGDSLNDAMAARAAGCHIFCVPYGYNEGRGVNELNCDAVVSSLLEATKLIKK
ncbi:MULTISPECIES: phosphoglycolate phosphatase [Nitrosomonas]|uniref:Phosphoglycolate phosphatase n=1 Tax=Nitrosomonas communis TaxID=44574 RepID=A0A0F7KBQ5_9PROT|nr:MULTISPECIES: phosphoglycolate phosphatase [Nitrosomonas]AKH37021.1 phosphoglycolate phosphatase [Nitrosomonas communis]TYP93245.1 phosphoglycolate phosphatase [Nitrosomonas communis]UVS62164.1 phosphoglycolate phosphatase [Nitrosomonas sp. PLL12]